MQSRTGVWVPSWLADVPRDQWPQAARCATPESVRLELECQGVTSDYNTCESCGEPSKRNVCRRCALELWVPA